MNSIERVLLAMTVIFVITTALFGGLYYSGPAVQVRTVTVTNRETVTQSVTTTIKETATITVRPEPVRVGFSASMTGIFAQIGQHSEKAFQIWADEVNKKGGLLGRQVVLIPIDDGSDTKKAVSNYERLINVDKVDLVFNPGNSAIGFATAPLLDKSKYPTLLTSAASERIYNQGFRYVFGSYSPTRQYGEPFIDAMRAKDPTVKRIAIVFLASEFAEDLADGTKKYSESKGLEVVLYERFPGDITTFVPLLEKVKARNPDLLLMAGTDPHYLLVSRQLREVGYAPKAYYFVFGPYGEKNVQTLGPVADYSYSAVQWLHYPVFKDPGTQEFTEEFKKRAGFLPGYIAASAYASAKMTEEAATRAGSLDRDKVRDSLEKILTEGRNVIGWKVKIDPKTLQNTAPVILFQIQKGNWVIVWPRDMAAGDHLYPAPAWDKR